MDLGEFVLTVASNVLMERDRLESLADELLPYLAIYTGYNMRSTGNMKDSFNPVEFAKQVYAKESVWGTDRKEEDPKKDYEAERAKLEQRFNLPKQV